ncbi:endonuclease/exonuclease/phosphatase family protein [Naumannella halotolerans]|uniref:Endonuclease/exonuclease/phosphatase family metal-dependent hydrolase n=1 Tax=Naumannella halotolerans TaxID=993414 RepID=A0A4R7JB10_9ACTN|nr:endonuclease/exonuclease/phosphatase family protein [Naumannella halotolerans]TDT33827.1 endonuclease/exonuclease/phosphatase family metal-dependent hydrolase [Naumannella halotolerans]
MPPIDRRRILIGGAAAGAAALALGATDTAAADSRRRHRGRGLQVMSYNIRQDTGQTQPGEDDYWPEREPVLIKLLRQEEPGLLGVQEAQFNQLASIEEALPDHRMIGYGRQGGSKDEYSAIFYDAQRFSVLEWDQFWLSDTPDLIGSTSWGNSVTRVVVWARLQDRRSRDEFIMINTHFDHQSEPARIRSAEAIIELAGEFDDLPVILTGDFNTPASQDSGSYRTLVVDGPFQDSWNEAKRRLSPEYGTFLGYEEPVVGNDRIDWVLTDHTITVEKAKINIYSRGGRFASDHAPVQAWLTFSE